MSFSNSNIYPTELETPIFSVSAATALGGKVKFKFSLYARQWMTFPNLCDLTIRLGLALGRHGSLEQTKFTIAYLGRFVLPLPGKVHSWILEHPSLQES